MSKDWAMKAAMEWLGTGDKDPGAVELAKHIRIHSSPRDEAVERLIKVADKVESDLCTCDDVVCTARRRAHMLELRNAISNSRQHFEKK